MLYQANAKSTGAVFAFWSFLGMFGARRFYLQRGGTAQLILTIIGIVTLIIVVGGFVLLAVAIWVFINAFSLANWTSDYNTRLAHKMAG